MSKETRKSVWNRVSFQKNFFTGLFIVLPIILSFSVFIFIINFIMNFFKIDPLLKLISKFIEKKGFESVDAGWLKVYFIIVLIVFFVSILYLIGLFARYLFIRKTIQFIESILYKIPIFNKIYITVKQIASAFKSAKATIFKHVVLIEYPRKGLYTLGFLTLKAEGEIQDFTQESVCSVFIPTTPNPTSGFLLMVPEKDIIYLNMSVEDALKLIISGGAVIPSKEKLIDDAFEEEKEDN